MIRPDDRTPEERRQDAIDDAKTIAEIYWGPVIRRMIEIMKKRGIIPESPL